MPLSCDLNKTFSVITTFFCRMKTVEVRGKSTRGLRRVYIIIPQYIEDKMWLLVDNPGKYMFSTLVFYKISSLVIV